VNVIFVCGPSNEVATSLTGSHQRPRRVGFELWAPEEETLSKSVIVTANDGEIVQTRRLCLDSVRWNLTSSGISARDRNAAYWEGRRSRMEDKAIRSSSSAETSSTTDKGTNFMILAQNISKLFLRTNDKALNFSVEQID
jgi:hypothetical protein